MNQQNMGSSKRSASSTAGKIAAKSHEAAEQWKEAVVDQAQHVRDKAQSAKDHTTDRIRGVATQLQNVSDTLRDDDPLVAGLAERASRSVEGVADYVSRASAQSFVRDAEQLARRQPALFFGAAFLLGLAAGRFVKSSSPGGSFQSGDHGASDGGALATRQDRESGFFTPAERATRADPRGDAAFRGDPAERATDDANVGGGSTTGEGRRS
jgi:hypothetical protein